MRIPVYTKFSIKAARIALATLLCVFIGQNAQSQTLPPWDLDPDCNSIVTTGIAAVTCGVIETIPGPDQYSFGMIDLNGALPAAGRIDVTASVGMYHHPSWHIDSIGNVFGITMDFSGNTYITASSNYSADYFGSVGIIKYGIIGGGPEDLNAAGTVYKIDGAEGQAAVFAVLPQQEYGFEHISCEGFTTTVRSTGPSLGNIVYSEFSDHFYVTNMEDGRIYRLDTNGNIVDSYDPLDYDSGAVGPPAFSDMAYGLDVSNDGTQLFFGTVGGSSASGEPQIYSLDLNSDGSFVGTIDNTNMPAGATWDNYVGDETLHYTAPNAGAAAMSFISDLEFTPNGDLLVGNRGGCGNNLQSSYNHGGRSFLLSEMGGIYSNLVGNIYTSDGIFDDENCYGGVSVFENPAGSEEWVISCADMLEESGPHGICTQGANMFGAPFAPVSPAGVISYTPPSFLDPKGVGGDVFVYKQCQLAVACPTGIEGIEQTVCSGDSIDLDFNLIGADLDEVAIFWTDLAGNTIDPNGIVYDHTDCAPGMESYIVTAECLEDSTQVVTDTFSITVVPSDLNPFITTIEEPCNVDVVVDSACVDYITVIGDIPVINPGDSGTVVVDVVHNVLTCDTLSVELNYNCVCTISDLTATVGDCVDGTFMVTLDFNQDNVGPSFKVTDQDGNDLGTFNYADLPVMVGPFAGDPTVTYTLTIMDTEIADCMASIDVGPVNCAPECFASTKGAICEGDTLALMETGGDATGWMWSSDGAAVISDPTIQNPTATNVSDGETFTVVVTIDNGGTDSCSVVAMVNPLPGCEAINSGPICNGDTLFLDEIGGDATGWEWSTDGGATISDPTAQNPFATGVSNGETFTVVITDNNGCTSMCSTTAEVFDDPVCNAFVDGPICDGDTLFLFEDGGAAVSWSWSTDGGAAISDPTAQNPFATGVTDGETFTVVITDANGCMSMCSVTATVNDLPVCAATNDGPICDGETLTLGEEGGDAISWMWSSDGAAVISDVTAQNPTATGVTDGETFTVVITDANGCMSTCSTTATVFPNPDCIAGNDGPICLGDTLNLSEAGGDAISWMWSSDGSAVISDPTAQNPFATNVSDGEVFTVVVTDANGCTSTCTTTATVFDPPVVEVSNNGPICVGDLLWLMSDVTGGTPPYTYSWSHPNGFTANTADVFISMVTMLDEGPYTLEVKDANGCSAEATTMVEINFNLTDAGLIGGDEYFCGPGFDPGPIFEITPPSGAPGVIEYFWMMKEEGDMQWSIIPGAEGPTYNPGPIYVTTQYTRCVRIDGCVLALESNVVTKTVGTEAIADPSGPASPCVDDLATYSVTPQQGATYSWDFGPGANPQFANTASVDVSWSSFGVRTITVTVTTATCTANNILEVNVSNSPVFCADFATPGTGVKDIAYQVFPNPFNNELQVVLDQPVEVRSQLRVANLQGSVVQTDWIAAGNAQTVLDMTTLPSGIYILTIDLGAAGVYHERVVKR